MTKFKMGRLDQYHPLNMDGRTGYTSIKRIFDVFFAAALLTLFSFPMLVIATAVKRSSPGPALYWSDRIGKGNVIFRMPKFRTMKIDTPALATHLMSSPDSYLTEIGRMLRKYSLDELPQLISVLEGHMSFVGPRPALFNQDDLIELRTNKGIQHLTPGITGWAQINGRDDLPIPQKVELDDYYLRHRSFAFDLIILLKTIFSVFKGAGVTH